MIHPKRICVLRGLGKLKLSPPNKKERDAPNPKTNSPFLQGPMNQKVGARTRISIRYMDHAPFSGD